MQILIAPSCFKEGLAADEVARAIDEGLQRSLPQSRRMLLPLTDGGEGFAHTLVDATDGRLEEVSVSGPLGGLVAGRIGWLGGSGDTAVVEIASAAGLRLMPRAQRNPLVASSHGVGELIRAALDGGPRRLLIGCGDSGTSDGGLGLARALGIRFLDVHGRDLPRRVDALLDLHHIDRSGLDPRLSSVEVEAACSMFTTMVGPRGTAVLFGPQKGADPAMVDLLARAHGRLAEVIARDTGVDVAQLPGGGAAGGMGAALHALVGARLNWRYDVVFRFLPFDARLEEADLLVTAEGNLDAQSPRDKIPCEVGRRARARGVPVVALAGGLGEGADCVLECGIDGYYGIAGGVRGLEEALATARTRVSAAAEALGRALLLGRRVWEREAAPSAATA